MIKKRNVMSLLPKSEKSYQITASLLNQWQRIFDAKDWVKEADDDDKSYETKAAEASDQAKVDFLNVLKRIPTPDNDAMKKGREYESSVYEGKDEIFSPIVENGQFQATFTKRITVDGTPITLYGVLDVLKAGRIMDIKRVGYYSSGKYKGSHQHPMYLELVPNAIDFTYLIMDDKGNHHTERYIRENSEDIKTVCSQFLSWLKANDLFETYKQNWDAETLAAKAARRQQNARKL